jgi:hypothetical protein
MILTILLVTLFDPTLQSQDSNLKQIYNYYTSIVGYVQSKEGTGSGFLIKEKRNISINQSQSQQ